MGWLNYIREDFLEGHGCCFKILKHCYGEEREAPQDSARINSRKFPGADSRMNVNICSNIYSTGSYLEGILESLTGQGD